MLVKRRKEAVREICMMCQEFESKHDKFFMEEWCKKIKVLEQIEEIRNNLKESKDKSEF